MTEEFQGAIIYCPVCTTNLDVEEPGEQQFQCASCGTEFSVTIEPEIVATHAMFG